MTFVSDVKEHPELENGDKAMLEKLLRPGAQKSLGIPTSDPAAALRFCQALSRALEAIEYEPCVNDTSISSNRSAIVPPVNEPQPDLSVVIPIYNEAENIKSLYEHLLSVLTSVELTYEIIFVDDGSRDNSLDLLHDLTGKDPRILIIELARNFGHQVAISAGLDSARGTAVVVMDADLQDPPELLPQFVTKWQEGYQVVYAVREKRKEGWCKRTAYTTFYRLLQRVADISIPLDAGDFCLMDRRVVDLLIAMPERNRFIRGIRSWVGLNQIGISYERPERSAGQPKYTFAKLILLALDGFVSFSHAPLRIASLAGVGISLFSFFMALFFFSKRLITGLNPPGFTTLVVAIFFLAGIQLITIGVMGEYIGRIFDEVKQRPRYVIRKISRARSE
ncbi:MAG: glycosyltransferase family 2 protein [Candidatus Binatia bacterium]